MTDAQALSRWIAREVGKLGADPDQRNASRYLNAIGRLSAHDAIMLFAFTLITDAKLPDLDKIKDGEA